MSTSQVRFASTVMLVREADRAFEVLLLRRNKDLAFAGGAHVFPGGSVDSSDAQPGLIARCFGLSAAEADERLGTPDALSFYIAALREAFEEAGILLVSKDSGQLVDDLDEKLRDCRQSLVAGQCTFTEIVETLDLHLDVGALAYVAHWVTPEGAPRRFDTRFFLASVPSQQRATPDRSEIVGQVWVTPLDALDQYRRGYFELVLPTVKNLEFLASFDTVDHLMGGARSLASVERIQPRFYRNVDGSVAVALPGSLEYEHASATVLAHGEALPTRPSQGK